MFQTIDNWYAEHPKFKRANDWLLRNLGFDSLRLIFVIILLTALIFYDLGNTQEKITKLIIGLTAISLMQYTVETHKMRWEQIGIFRIQSKYYETELNKTKSVSTETGQSDR